MGGSPGLVQFPDDLSLVVTMDVILKVLEGAKTGTKIAVKKDEFLVGRSQKCSLCVGSSSVSRRHCQITRNGTTVTIKDLGSRNGTLVNGNKIEGEVELTSGDELGIGTLKLLMTITQGINNQKKPKVESVAQAVERTVSTGDSTVAEDDITKWLHDAPGPPPSSQVMSETQTIRMDDTNAMQLKQKIEEQQAEEAREEQAEETDEAETEEAADDKKSKKKKKEPGKLPKIPTEPSSKDSREAAMMALRNWNRRR